MKKNKIFKLTLLVLTMVFMLINPVNSYAKEMVCNYEYKGNLLTYKVDNGLLNPIKDGNLLNNKEWYNSENFEETFLKSSMTNKKEFVCPSLVIEENEKFSTVFVNSRSEKDCNGKCTKIYASENDGLRVVNSKIGSAIGIYKRAEFFIPTFRKLSNGLVEWSVDNKTYYNINNAIKIGKNSEVILDEKLSKNIFTNEDKSDRIYRCIFTSGDKTVYNLTDTKNSCKKDLSENDNQGFIADSYNGIKGSDNCKSTILGSTEDENSVAWLLQKILNYLRVLGPMIILVMSAIDFTKAIVTGDDDTMQKCYKKLVKRLVLAILLFFVPTLVTVILELFGFIGDPICVLD